MFHQTFSSRLRFWQFVNVIQTSCLKLQMSKVLHWTMNIAISTPSHAIELRCCVINLLMFWIHWNISCPAVVLLQSLLHCFVCLFFVPRGQKLRRHFWHTTQKEQRDSWDLLKLFLPSCVFPRLFSTLETAYGSNLLLRVHLPRGNESMLRRQIEDLTKCVLPKHHNLTAFENVEIFTIIYWWQLSAENTLAK